ncbi:hypothetical protein HHI36_001383 [Cryptolaemus montrouzieri]|uniref:Uncharacterized protein n=1 Tax=Cryptolaemus montrouzieri TaxID=559131 RepID=A0ABD2P887_9CUCU
MSKRFIYSKNRREYCTKKKKTKKDETFEESISDIVNNSFTGTKVDIKKKKKKNIGFLKKQKLVKKLLPKT